MRSVVFGLADTAPYFLIRLVNALHRYISSFKSSPLQDKVQKNLPLLGLIANLTCDVSLPFHMHQHMPKVFPVCHAVQRATKNKNNIYIIIMICKVYIFKSYSRQSKFYFNKRREILSSSLSYCITVLLEQRPLQTEPLEKIIESFFRESCCFSHWQSLCSRNTWMSHLQKFLKVKVLIYRLVAFRSLTCIFI